MAPYCHDNSDFVFELITVRKCNETSDCTIVAIRPRYVVHQLWTIRCSFALCCGTHSKHIIISINIINISINIINTINIIITNIINIIINTIMDK
jgi:hypothetical protein